MTVKLLTEQQLKFLSSTGGCTGSSESIHVKTLHCWKSHVEAQITPDRRQSKTLLTFDQCGSKIDRNSVYDCHLSPVGRQMTIEKAVSNYF